MDDKPILGKACKTKILKKIKVPEYNKGQISRDICISVSNYGYCPLKIGDEFMEYTNFMFDFHLDDLEKRIGSDSIERYSLHGNTLILAHTPDGIEGIVWPYEMDEVRPMANDVLYVSIQDKGYLILSNLEIKLFMNIHNRTEKELDAIWR